MIRFKAIRWKNLLSYGDFWTELAIGDNTSTLVIGDNGAGKSTFIDALCYGLYGKAFRKIATTQLVNTVNNGHMMVEVIFDIGRDTYKVVRGLKPRVFEVWKNDKLLNQEANARDYQDVLEKNILKINHKSFTQIIVLGSSSFIPFMQLKTNDRREVIEDLLDIGIFSIMQVLLKDKVSDNKDKLQTVKHNKDLINNQIETIHEYIEKLESQKDEEIKKKHGQISENKVKLAAIQQEIEDFQNSIKNIRSIHKVDEKDKIEKELAKGQKIKSEIASKARALASEISFFERHDTCPTCQQPMDEDHKHSRVQSSGSRADELNNQISALQEILDKKDQAIQSITNALSEINDIQYKVIDKQSQMNSLNALNNQLEQQVSEVRNNENLIKEERQKIEDLQIRNEDLYREQASLARDKAVMDMATKLLKDSGIKSKIIKQYVPIMNKLINKYLAAMDFFVQFELDENFNEVIRSRFRDEFSYASFSEGEKMRIDLALLFTWRAIAKLKNSAATNLLIMDEVFDSSLDSSGTDDFMKIIMDIVSDTNVYIISHKTDQLVDRFTNVIRFEKHKNFSRMVI